MEQMPLRQLLREDEIFKKWFMKIPNLEAVGYTPPWRLFIQKEEGGRWARGDYPSYPKAYTELRLRLPDIYDAAIHSRRHPFSPPVLKKAGKKYRLPMPPEHGWCSHCRRPVIFKFYTKHPNLPIRTVDPVLRCCICGMRQTGMKIFRSNLSWPAK